MATATIEQVKLNEGMEAGLRLQVSKVIRAKRERVFEAWTKPELLKSWFGPEGMQAREVTCDLQEGGAWSIVMQGTSEECDGPEGTRTPGRTAAAAGVYRKIVPNETLSFTWNGNWVPGEESLVTVLLRDVDGGTEVTIMHERFQMEASMRGHEQGWMASLRKMAKVIGD